MNPVVYSGKGSYSAASMIKGMRDIAKIMNLLGINPDHFSCAEYSKALNATPERIPSLSTLKKYEAVSVAEKRYRKDGRTICRCWYQLNTEEFEQYQRGFAAWLHAVSREGVRL